MQGDWIQEAELRRLSKLRAWSGFTTAQRGAVERVDALLLMKGARPATRVRFASKARKLARFLDKPFEETTREDLVRFLSEASETHKLEAVRFVRSFIRRFYTLLLSPYDEKPPDLVSWIKTSKPRATHTKPLPVLKPDDVRAMIIATKGLRDRAIVSVLYESGARISELMGLSLSDVAFDDYGARITVDGKTGVRRVRLIQSVPDLRNWVNAHPFRTLPKAPLFVRHNIRHAPRPLMQAGVRFILADAAKRAGVEKRVNPHSFRKARATELSQRLTPSELSIYHGWVQGSAMPQVYIHLTGDDVEKKLLQQAGLFKDAAATANPLKPIECARCQTVNPPTNALCGKCSFILDETQRSDLVKERDELAARAPQLLRLLEDPELSALLTRKIVELSQRGPLHTLPRETNATPEAKPKP